ncbi:MAG: hypothetical protein E4H00_03305, partial [Myxococcales bacterium]
MSVRFSPVLLAVALTPIALETSTPLGCELGDTALVEFELIVRGENRIVGFDRSQRSYSVSLPWGTDEVRVRALSTDPEARLWVRLLIDGELVGDLGSPFVEGANVGGADLVVSLPPGSSTLEVWVTPPPGGVTDHYDVAVQIGGGIDPGGLVYESCSAEQTGGAGLPLAIDLDSNGDAWVLGEFHTHLQFIRKTSPCPERALIEIPHHAGAAPFCYSGKPSQASVFGESVVWDANDSIVWFSQGGASLEDTAVNHSRIVSYHPGTTTFKAYNIPGDRNEAQGIYWDQTRNWVWFTESGLYSDTTADPVPHQATITAFDPDTAPYDTDFLWDVSLDPYLCGEEEEPTADGCFKRFALPSAQWVAGGQVGPFGTAHLAGDANGDIWFTNFWGGSIGHLDPSTETATIYPLEAAIGTSVPAFIVGPGPWEIEISPDGQYVVWTEYFDSTISRMLISNADNVACQSLDGSGDNPCVEEMRVPLDLSIENIHSIAYDANGSLWFGTGTSNETAHGVVYSTLGFVYPDWSGVTLLDPPDFTP